MQGQLQKQEPEEEILQKMIHVLCSTYGWDYYTLLKQPLPFIWGLFECILAENMVQQKEMNKTKSKIKLPNKGRVGFGNGTH